MLVVKLLYINPWDPLRSKAYETGTWYQPVFLKIFPYHLRTHQTYFLETNKNKRIIVFGLFYGIKDPLIVIKNIPSIFHHEISRISNTDLKSQLLFDATKPANWCNNNFKINVTMKRYVCISIFIHDVTPKESWVSFKKMNRKYETVLRQVYEYNVKNIHWFGCLHITAVLQLIQKLKHSIWNTKQALPHMLLLCSIKAFIHLYFKKFFRIKKEIGYNLQDFTFFKVKLTTSH